MINSFYQRTKNYVSNQPPMVWVLLGFFITFIWFFIWPIFFNPTLSMQFNKYIPVVLPIGHDFREIVTVASAWIYTGVPPIILYPPLTLMFFAPFTLTTYEIGYKILTGIIIVCYILIAFALPRRMNKSRDIFAFGTLIFITGIVSYGFQFEIERGQWNIIAFTFAMAAIYIFHHQPKRRWLAYLLFTLSIQLKLYPAIFVFAFVEDWRDWKNNIKRMAGLGLVNILGLFILGPAPILNTLTSLIGIKSSHTGTSFNLSISSFTLYVLSSNLMPHKRIFIWLLDNSWVPQLFLYVSFVIGFLIILRQAYKTRARGFNPYIFLACSIGACVIPSISFDYKLAILPASIAVSIPAILLSEKDGHGSGGPVDAYFFDRLFVNALFIYEQTRPCQKQFPRFGDHLYSLRGFILY